VSADLIVQLVLGGFGLTGVIGAIVALWKVRPEVNSAAVTQSQGAMETMKTLNDELEQAHERVGRDRDEWRTRALAAEAQLRVLERKNQ
jgi:hypothetical protein